MRAVIVFLVCLVSLGAHSRPDQQAVVSRGDAKLAVDLLLRHDRVAHWCEPCGETVPRVGSRGFISAGPWAPDPASWAVYEDGQMLDLAYVYVPGGSGRSAPFVNLAGVLGLPVTGVSAFARAPR